MNHLQPVTINNSDSCLTYALQRVGLDEQLPDFRCLTQVHKYFDVIPYQEFIDRPIGTGTSEEKLPVGTLLMWETPHTDWSGWRNEIDSNGIITSVNRHEVRHIGVVELDGMVSDATRKESRWISIRMRYLCRISKNPTHVLIKKSKYV